MESKQRSEERKRIVEQRRLELFRNLGKGGNTVSREGPKTYAVLLFDGLPGEKNAPKQQAKGLSADEAGRKAQSWLEMADLYVVFPYLVIMGPPPELPATAAAKSSPFPPSPPGG